MLEHIDLVAEFTREGREAFMQNRKVQFAVIRAYEVIGEIAKRLPTELTASQPQIAWQDIKTFRDFLAHNYDRVRLDIVWAAVEDVPNLRSAVEMLIRDAKDTPPNI